VLDEEDTERERERVPIMIDVVVVK